MQICPERETAMPSSKNQVSHPFLYSIPASIRSKHIQMHSLATHVNYLWDIGALRFLDSQTNSQSIRRGDFLASPPCCHLEVQGIHVMYIHTPCQEWLERGQYVH
jgi:hypothetical protein